MDPSFLPEKAARNIRWFFVFRVCFVARFYYPVYALIFLDHGLTLEQFGILNALWATIVVLLKIPSGAFADTWIGSPATGPDTQATDRGFTGHEMLDELGLVHMNGRIYDPLLGRFLSADPIVQFENDLQNYNRYTYVRSFFVISCGVFF